MKYFIFSLFTLFLAGTFTSCGSDDDSMQYQYHSISIRTADTYNLPAGTSGFTTSDSYVLTIDNSGIIRPHHVGKATVETYGNRIKYTYTVDVVPVKKLFTDLGNCVNGSRSDLERILGAPTSSTGYKYNYPCPLLEEEIEVRYNKDYIMDYAIQTFDNKYSDAITDQILEYYDYYAKDQNDFTIYINANKFDEANVLLVRNQNGTNDRIIYMTPNTYSLVGDIGSIFN